MRSAPLLFTLAASLPLSAQNFPFPTSNASWVQYFEVMVSPPPLPNFMLQSTANFCMDGTDTLIAGNTYAQLRYCDAGYVGGIRSVNEAVYFHPADSTQEYLLYDMGASVGDTLFDVYVDEMLATGSEGWMGRRLIDVEVIAKAPSAAYGGRIAMQVYAFDQDISMASEWIEGIGCVFGLFTLNPLNISQYWYGMACMSHNDTTYWNGSYVEDPGTCAPLHVGLNETAVQGVEALLYPNPTTGIVHLSGVDTRNGLEVRDALGRPVLVPLPVTTRDRVQLDLGALPAGLYLVCDANGHTLGRVLRE